MEKVRILVIRFSSIGDIVLTSPVVRMLKEQVQGSEVHFLTKNRFYDLVAYNPNIDKVHLLQDDFSGLIKALKAEEYDYIIDLHRNLRSLRVKNALRRLSFSFNKLNLRKWLYVRFKLNRLPQVHIVDRYLETIKFFDIRNDKKGLDYFLPDNFKADHSLPQKFEAGYTAVVMGANHYTKQIPPAVLRDIINKHGKPVILLGGKTEQSQTKQFIADISVPVMDMCGKLSVNGSAHIIKHAKVILTPDTGMMHIAAALNKYIVSMWGNTTPEFGMYPYMPQHENYHYIAQVNNLSCRPCSKIGFNRCPKKHFHCMLKQDQTNIVNQLNQYWEMHA